jgi:hypothetical protein
LLRSRFWPGRFTDLMDLNTQAHRWRDEHANARVHDQTGKVPALVFRHEEQRKLKPIPAAPFDVDDVEPYSVTKSFRVSFDRNRYSVPWRLVGQHVLVRATDDAIAIFLGPKQVAAHRRSWDIGEDLEHPSHREGLLQRKPRAAAQALPPGLLGLEDTGTSYFKIFAASGRSIHRETIRLTFLVELFGEHATRAAISEVMATGQVGSEYVEYVLRHKKGLAPSAAPLRRCAWGTRCSMRSRVNAHLGILRCRRSLRRPEQLHLRRCARNCSGTAWSRSRIGICFRSVHRPTCTAVRTKSWIELWAKPRSCSHLEYPSRCGPDEDFRARSSAAGSSKYWSIMCPARASCLTQRWTLRLCGAERSCSRGGIGRLGHSVKRSGPLRITAGSAESQLCGAPHNWLYAYRAGGLTAPRPQPRSDRGRGRELTPEQRDPEPAPAAATVCAG